MSAWTLIPCLAQLRDEFTAVAPRRDKGADGAIGDSSHTSSSDHTPDEDSDVLRDHDADSKNEVHALDIDSTGPWPDGKGGEAGAWFDRTIRDIAEWERAEYASPDVYGRLQYIIWRGQIISRSWGWSEWRPYSGPSKHFDHAHFSARYLTRTETDTRSWGILKEDDVTKAELHAWLTEWAKSSGGRTALAQAVLAFDPGPGVAGGVPNPDPDPAKVRANPTLSPSHALRQAILAPILGYQIRGLITELAKAQGLGDAQIKAAIAGLPGEVLDALGDADRSDAELVAILRAVLGDRADEVGRLLASATS